MNQKELIIVVDFGGQYNQLIARRVRENHVYCEVYPYDKAVAKIKELNEAFMSDAALQIEKGNKAAGTRARKASLELEKLMKEFRKASLEASK